VNAPGSTPPAPAVSELSDGERAAFEGILDYMHACRCIHFRAYRQATIARRVKNRMISANVGDYASYLARLQADPGEAQRLLERLTIKVSEFFRHPAGFEALEHALAERLPARPDRHVSLWSAGCAQGEEAYSLAIVLAELGVDASCGPPVWATDIDPSALERAHRGAYPDRALVEHVSAERLAAHFTPLPPTKAHAIHPHLRAYVRFTLHDLCAPAPIDRRFDVISCRNTLIYFQPELQRRVQQLLCACLEPGGLLLLGEAEWIHPDLAPHFDVLDGKGRLFELRRSAGGAS
jgi:chemotaxis methyl-accepting protein methylase